MGMNEYRVRKAARLLKVRDDAQDWLDTIAPAEHKEYPEAEFQIQLYKPKDATFLGFGDEGFEMPREYAIAALEAIRDKAASKLRTLGIHPDGDHGGAES